MPRSNKALVTFTAGEWSPSKDARADLEKASAALRTCRNMIVDRYGGVFRRPGLKFISAVKSFAAISYVSFEGSGTLYGITEFGDLSDPPRKYRVLNHNYANFNRWTPSGSYYLNQYFNALRINYNNAGSKAETYGYSRYRFGAGNTFNGETTLGISGWPDWVGMFSDGGGTGGGTTIDTFEDWNQDAGTTPPSYSPNFFGTIVRAKRKKSTNISTISKVTGEHADSPAAALISDILGEPTNPLANTRVYFHAVKGSGVWTCFVLYSMDNPAIGDGPWTSLYMDIVSGDNPVPVFASADGVFIRSGTAGPGSGSDHFARRFTLPEDVSIRFRLNITGYDEDYFPTAWEDAASRPITEAEARASGARNWIYLPVATTGTTVANGEMAEFLTTEDKPIDFLELSGASGVTEGAEEWAETSAFTGGVTAESHSPINYTMRVVKSSYTLTGLTVGYTYPITLTYSERDIGGANPNNLQEVVNVVASSASEQFTQEVVAESGRQRKLVTATKGVGVAPVSVTTIEVETLLWKAELLAAGKTATSTEITAVNNFIAALRANSLLDYMRYVLPFVGNDIAAAMIPIYDRNGEGSAVNAGSFVDGDRSSLGLSGNGTSKYLTVPFKFSDLGGQSSGWRWGAGAKITRHSFAGTSGSWNLGIWNAAPDQAYGVRPSFKDIQLSAGTFGHAATYSHEATNGENILGSVSSDTSRKIFLDGALVATATSTTNSSDAGYTDILVFGDNFSGTRYYAGSMSVVYFTTGTLSDADNIILQGLIDDLHTDLGRTVSAEEPEISTWLDRITINSGTLTSNSLTYATDLLADLKAWSGFSKLMYLAPFLGNSIATATVPLVDRDILGILANTGFVDGDADEATGLAGDGSSKYLSLPYASNQLGASDNFGVGWYEADMASVLAEGYPAGAIGPSTTRDFIRVRPGTPDMSFFRGVAANPATLSAALTNGFFFGNRSSSTVRNFWKDGVKVATNTTSDATSASNLSHFVFAANSNGSPAGYWQGTMGIYLATTGALSDVEVGSLNTIIQDFITATGR